MLFLQDTLRAETGALASAWVPHLRSLVPLTLPGTLESPGYAASTSARRALVADIAGQDVRGTSYGLYTLACFPGAVVRPLAGGWLYEN